MKTKGYGRIVTGCVLCAGIVCGGAGCSNHSRPKGEAAPVTIAYDQDSEVTFIDSKGQVETVLTIGKGSTCTGVADGKKTYRQSSCSFKPGSGTINGDAVKTYWESPTGTANRDADDVLKEVQTVGLRVVKDGPKGYDCTSSATQEAPRKFEWSARLYKNRIETLTLAENQQTGPIFSTGPSCSSSQKIALETALAKLRDLKEILNVACW